MDPTAVEHALRPTALHDGPAVAVAHAKVPDEAAAVKRHVRARLAEEGQSLDYGPDRAVDHGYPPLEIQAHSGLYPKLVKAEERQLLALFAEVVVRESVTDVLYHLPVLTVADKLVNLVPELVDFDEESTDPPGLRREALWRPLEPQPLRAPLLERSTPRGARRRRHGRRGGDVVEQASAQGAVDEERLDGIRAEVLAGLHSDMPCD
mmetsp:Transcript_24200/g.54900  ORF Transcript_24200/g.54900 Transcript_24200/m.54900 type:complete len:207 (+) Transcript_24200:1212-1832(+)